MPHVVCLIPARGGSKRIPSKNIRSFAGKPLISWSIEAASHCDIIDSVYVSTDSHEIANISESAGAKIPFIRPYKYSNDTAVDSDVRNHFLQWAKQTNLQVDYLYYIYPTAPLLTTYVIGQMFNTLRRNNANKCMTVVKQPFPILQSCTYQSDFLQYYWPDYATKRTQEMPEFLVDAGQCYLFDIKKLTEGEKMVGQVIPLITACDIDTLEDFNHAEFIFKSLVNFGWKHPYEIPDLSILS